MSSKRAVRRKSCERKKKYDDEKRAKTAAYYARRRSKEYILCYKCKFCGAWHIGHPPKHVKQSIRDKRRNE